MLFQQTFQFPDQGRETNGTARRQAVWGLVLLVICSAIVYSVISTGIIRHQRSSLVASRLAVLAQAAVVVRNDISAAGGRHDNFDQELINSIQNVHAAGQGDGIGIVLVADDGSILARSTGFLLSGITNLGPYKISSDYSGTELQFPAALSENQFCQGELLLPSGVPSGLLVATNYSAADSWHVAAVAGMQDAADLTRSTMLYLLISFLSLTLLLMGMFCWLFLSLANRLSLAVNSAVALDQATIRFQESLGQFRRPLHSIQGLADMLQITEDPDERSGYISEIKGEVSRIIRDLETSEP